MVFWIPYWLAWWLSYGFDTSKYLHSDSYFSDPYSFDDADYDEPVVVQADFNPFTNQPGLSKGQGRNKMFLC